MAQNVLTITQINEYIRSMMDNDRLLVNVAVKGEISNYKVYPSGHHYFTLKDEGGALRGVLFKGNAMRLRFRPENGMQVIAMGRITVYPRDGAYQLYCTGLVLDGVGDLYAAFEQMKNRLAAQGLFDPAHKKPLPKLPGTIGIITSSAGAAVHDMLRILRKRYPLTKVLLLPVRVQGTEAPGEIAAAIGYANAYRLADLLIVGRGGGSMEDLWAFNEEVVARAIFECDTPVISAVGHETDTTIADFVADMRAPTPSAAAELAVFDYAQFCAGLQGMEELLQRKMEQRIQSSRDQLTQMNLLLRLQHPQNRINTQRQYLSELEDRLHGSMERKLIDLQHQFAIVSERLEGLSPLKKLQGGYGYVHTKQGPLTTVAEVQAGEPVWIRIQDGSIQAQVTKVTAEDSDA